MHVNDSSSSSEFPIPAKLTTLASALRSDSLPLETYLNLVERWVRAQEPQVLALVEEAERFARLRREACRLQARYADPSKRPMLFGILFGVKDIIHIDGFPTRAGALRPWPALQGGEGSVVKRLKENGALVLGKTCTTNYADLSFAPSPTRNPRRLDYSPGGSSSGSAAAVAAGFCPLALGTQTVGSLLRPASYCGVVGYKPSYGRTPTEGTIPLAPSLDHLGLITRDVGDVRLVASLLCRSWRAKEASERRPVLGIPEGPYLARASEEGLFYFRQSCQRLVEVGYQVVSVSALQAFDQIYNSHSAIMAAEAAHLHGERLEHRDKELPQLLAAARSVDRKTLRRSRAGRLKLREELVLTMRQHGIDLWLSPSAPGAPPSGLEDTGDAVMNLPWTYSGLPALSIPSALTSEGLPIGLQVVARWWADEALLRWGKDLERALRSGGAKDRRDS